VAGGCGSRGRLFKSEVGPWNYDANTWSIRWDFFSMRRSPGLSWKIGPAPASESDAGIWIGNRNPGRGPPARGPADGLSASRGDTEALLKRDQGGFMGQREGRFRRHRAHCLCWPPLSSCQPCFWKVRFYNQDNKASAWTRPARWEMACSSRKAGRPMDGCGGYRYVGRKPHRHRSSSRFSAQCTERMKEGRTLPDGRRSGAGYGLAINVETTRSGGDPSFGKVKKLTVDMNWAANASSATVDEMAAMSFRKASRCRPDDGVPYLRKDHETGRQKRSVRPGFM